jgi:HEAT repeat protein
MARPTQLEGRLVAVLAAGRNRTPARWTRWAITFGISVVAIALVGATPAGPSPTRRPVASLPYARWLLAQDAPTPAERMEARKTAHAAAATLESSADPETRQDAVMRIAASNADNSLRPLERALADPSPDVREKAALALGFMSTPDVIPSLLGALSDADPQVREKAAIGLALRHDDRVTEALLQAVDDADSQVREKVVIALATSGDARARAALDRALGDPDPQVREKAAAGLILLETGAPTGQQADSVRAGLRGILGAVIAATKATR